MLSDGTNPNIDRYRRALLFVPSTYCTSLTPYYLSSPVCPPEFSDPLLRDKLESIPDACYSLDDLDQTIIIDSVKGGQKGSVRTTRLDCKSIVTSQFVPTVVARSDCYDLN
jgi:hypothetical protein